MGFRKFQSVEKSSVLSSDELEKVSKNLHKLGKTSAKDLTDEERAVAFKKALDTNRVV